MWAHAVYLGVSLCVFSAASLQIEGSLTQGHIVTSSQGICRQVFRTLAGGFLQSICNLDKKRTESLAPTIQ